MKYKQIWYNLYTHFCDRLRYFLKESDIVQGIYVYILLKLMQFAVKQCYEWQ